MEAAHDTILCAAATSALGLTKAQEGICEALPCVKNPAKHHARSAINHLAKAWAMKDTDREMAVLRAITAEEEAATAVFKSLRRIGYSGISAINPHRHDHKAALFFLLEVVFSQKPLLDQLGVTLHLTLNTKATPYLIELAICLPHMKPLAMKPVPALHFNWKELEGVPFDFAAELENLYSERGIKCYKKEIKRRANARNQLLYAHDTGVPVIEHSIDQAIEKKKSVVFTYLTLLLMIDYTMEKQLFVQQCLNALVKIVKISSQKKEMERNIYEETSTSNVPIL